MLVWVRLKTLYNLQSTFFLQVVELGLCHDLEQTRVSVVEMWPGEQHGSSALTSANIEHSLGSAANITRGTEARAVFRREGGPLKNICVICHCQN